MKDRILHKSWKIIVVALLALLFGAGAHRAAFAADQVKVVYHLADGIDQATRAMANIRNHLRAEPDTKIVVVGHGEGIRFMLKGARQPDGRPFDEQISKLAAQGVEFRICNNTLTAHDIPLSQVVPEAKVVPSGVAEIARLQAKEGFVYLRP
jgi:intracellular sulfur oxidation DsrE/DsrF family protein